MRTMPSRRVVGNTRWLLAGGFSRESLYDEKDFHLEVPIAIQNTTAECVVSGNKYLLEHRRGKPMSDSISRGRLAINSAPGP